MIYCRICSTSFLDLEAFSIHARTKHEDVSADADSILWTKGKPFTNYCDSVKLEKDDHDVCIEGEGLHTTEQATTVDSENVNNIVIKSEHGLQLKKNPTENLDTATKIFVKEERDIQYAYDSTNALSMDQNGYNLRPACDEKGGFLLDSTKVEENYTTQYIENSTVKKEVDSSLQAACEITKQSFKLEIEEEDYTTEREEGLPLQAEVTDIIPESAHGPQLKRNTIEVLDNAAEIVKKETNTQYAIDLVDPPVYNLTPVCEETGAPPSNAITEENSITDHEGVLTMEEALDSSLLAVRKTTKEVTLTSRTVDSMKKNCKTAHSKRKAFSCHICNYKTNIKCNLTTHITIHSDDKPFSCPVCEYKCSIKHSLTKHMRKHTWEKRFVCDNCDYKCSVKQDLIRHMRKHTGSKPYACHICDYKCSVQYSLTKHIRTHTGEKPFSCHFCDYKCSVKQHLIRHIKKHTGYKPYACPICDYKCSIKQSLTMHMKTHTEEKPFACYNCNYKCSVKYSLNIHMRTHTGEKPFACHVCDYKCSVKSRLNVHLRRHTEEKPFSCHLCDYKCKVKCCLTTHMRKHTVKKSLLI